MTSQEEWRAELLEIYDKAYRRTHPKDDEGGGASVREPRKPKPSNPSTAVEIEMVTS